MANAFSTGSNGRTNQTTIVSDTAPKARREFNLAVTAAELQAERNGRLPVWVRCPKGSGTEFYSGFTRSKLYALASEGKVRSVSIREPGKIKGVRLFLLASVLDFIARCEVTANGEAAATKSNAGE